MSKRDDALLFRFRRDVVTREIDRGVLIVDLESGKTWKLNRVGAEVCGGIERQTDLADLAGQIAVRYGVAVDEVRRDVDLLVDSLRREHLIEQLPFG